MFSFFKIKKPVEGNGAELTGSAVESAGVDSAQAELVKSKVTSVKVLGSGCKRCHELYKNAQEAVQSLGCEADVKYVTDLEKLMAYNIMTPPALVVNEKVVSTGKMLSSAQVAAALIDFAKQN